MHLSCFGRGGENEAPTLPELLEISATIRNKAEALGSEFALTHEIVHKVRAKVACDGHFLLRLVFPSLYAAKARRRRFGAAGTLATKENTMPTGTVKFFNQDKGYGFIQPEGSGNDAFVHISAVERAGMTTLNKDQRVSYDLEQDQRGKTSAVNLQSA
jgi:CspA family cold shock protein